MILPKRSRAAGPLTPMLSGWKGYGVAVFLPLAASVLTLRLPALHYAPRLVLLAAVALSAWIGGTRCGLLATAVSIAAIVVDMKRMPAAAGSLPLAFVLLLFLSVSLILIWSQFSLRHSLEALAWSEARLRRILGNMTSMFFALDPQGKVVEINAKAASYFRECGASELSGRVFWDVFPKASKTIYYRQFEKAMREQKPVHFEAVSKNLSPGRWFEIYAYPSPDRLDIYSREITEHRRIQEELASSEELFGKAFFASPDAMVISRESDGQILEVNESFQPLFGYWPGEVIGKKFAAFGLSADSARKNLELEIHRKSGEKRRVNLSTQRIVIQGDPCLLSILHDVTEQKRAEAALRASQEALAVWNRRLEEEVERRTRELQAKERELEQTRRLEAMGQLAGGVAHDFNNLLTGIMGLAEEVLGELKDPRLREDLQEVMDTARRASDLTRQLLTIGRRQIRAPVLLNLNDVISGMTHLLQRSIREDIALERDLDPALDNVRVDRSQFEEVILNMAVNSQDAMPEGGRILIRTRNGRMRNGPSVVLSISDTGQGMEPETLRHVFEPFFTTKGPGQGTGLGLAIVYGIVKQHEGEISVESRPGEGTTFWISLPCATDPLADAEQTPVDRRRPKRGAGPGGTEAILLVEDEDIVRRVVSRALKKRGYQVLEAGNGPEAIVVAEKHAGAIDLLLTDVIMPGMNGCELAEKLVKKRPDLRILYMSGHGAGIISHRGILEPGFHFIEKSFSVDAIGHKVREVLDQPPAQYRKVPGTNT